jgi:hypothetical protein
MKIIKVIFFTKREDKENNFLSNKKSKGLNFGREAMSHFIFSAALFFK